MKDHPFNILLTLNLMKKERAATIDAIFEKLPNDDNFENSDIIPDFHKLIAEIQTTNGNKVNLELDVELGFNPKTERGMNFEFENGLVDIDVMKSKMLITLNSGTKFEFDLQTNNNDHADGDTYIAHTIFDTLPEGFYKATLNDETVILATFMGLISENQALHAHNNKMQNAEN